MRYHLLKSHPSVFEDVVQGRKTFEIRINDRDFAVGDRIMLREFDPAPGFGWPDGHHTSRAVDLGTISYLVQGLWGLPPNLCVFTWTDLKPLTFVGTREFPGHPNDELSPPNP